MPEKALHVVDRDQGNLIIAVTDADPWGGQSERWNQGLRLLDEARTLTIDLSGVDRLSSVTIAVLLRATRYCRARGGYVVLRNPSPSVRDMLVRTGLWSVFSADAVPPQRKGPS